MLLADSKVRCPSCGAKNEADAERCRTCTRSLPRDQLPSQAAYEEALYAKPVANARGGKRSGWMGPVTLVALLIVGLGAANYFKLGYGPTWAHRNLPSHEDSWRTLTGDGWNTLFPGRPIQDQIPTSTGDVQRDKVLIDGNWNSILDADTIGPGEQAQAVANQHATVIVAVTNSPADLASSAPTIVQQLVPAATLTDVNVTTPHDAATGTQVALTAHVTDGGGGDAPTGTAQVRLVAVGPTTYVIGSFVAHGDDPDLQASLVKEFRVGSGPAAPSVAH
jgi:hypothetical protein